MTKVLLLFLMSLFYSMGMAQQVGVNTESPNEKAVMDIVSSDRGVLIPRLTTVQRNAITPGTAERSLLIYNTDEDCFNYWLGTTWQSLCGNMAKSDYTIDCSSLQVHGTYTNDEVITANNFLTLKAVVTKAGQYIITASATVAANSNGYSFYTSGEFLSAGEYIVSVPAAGKPLNYSNPTPDNFTVTRNGSPTTCTFNVQVMNAAIKPLYEINCASVTANGTYIEGVALNAGNTITLSITPANALAVGAIYDIQTNTVDGISFRGTGTITSTNPQTVSLQGSGMPYGINTKKLIISTNSESSTTRCNASITTVIPTKRMLTVGNISGADFVVGSKVYDMIMDTNNFGPGATSIVKYQGWGGGAHTHVTDLSNLANYTSGANKADIILISGATISDPQATSLADFARAGGVLIVFSNDNTSNKRLFDKIFGTATTATSVGTENPAGAVYELPTRSDDILYGTFGNVAGLYWGQEGANVTYMSDISFEDVINYSSTVNLSGSTTFASGRSTAFRHRYLPVVWVGNSAFNKGGTASGTANPFQLTTKVIGGVSYPNYPGNNAPYGNASNKYPVFNAMFTANIIAWALKQAQ
ncbi:MAG: hypothetical protein LBQ73_02620 [Tannerellaceae bacterium]|jgi:hypothetical protein|nr:hypothetical protein [Tannerellaceae bacterium]